MKKTNHRVTENTEKKELFSRIKGELLMRNSALVRVSIICVFVVGGFLVTRLILDEAPGVLADSPPSQQTPTPSDNGQSRESSSDGDQPIPLPSRAEPVPDRTSLDDPTLAASTAAATAAPIPPRTRKAPFLKQTAPDPYDGRRTAMPDLEESKDLPFGSPQTPRR
jgi:hypothetical protein